MGFKERRQDFLAAHARARAPHRISAIDRHNNAMTPARAAGAPHRFSSIFI